MKKKYLTLLVAGMLVSLAQAQKASDIFINTDVFVQLVFKSPIQSIKTGAPDMIVTDFQENSLTLQAISTEVKTNLVVKTSDGLYYSYMVKSEEDVDKVKLFYEVEGKEAVNFKEVTETKNKKDASEKFNSQEVAERILNMRGGIKNKNEADYKQIYLKIKGIYSYEEKMYFLFEMRNESNINYKIEKLQYVTLPIEKGKKRIQSEEKEYIPLYYYNFSDILEKNSKRSIVAVFNKFTLNNDKQLEVVFNENGGERTVRLYIKSDWLSKARLIN